MEQTTLQQRIEERAKAKLEKDLIDLSNLLDNCALLRSTSKTDVPFPTFDGFNISALLYSHYHTEPYGNYRNYANIRGEYAKKLFDYWLPVYIEQATDEILQKIDELSNLVETHEIDSM